MKTKVLLAAIVAVAVGLGFGVATPAAFAQQTKEKPAKAEKQSSGQKKGVSKCEKLTDETKKQACIAQEAKEKEKGKATKEKVKKEKVKKEKAKKTT